MYRHMADEVKCCNVIEQVVVSVGKERLLNERTNELEPKMRGWNVLLLQRM